MFYSTTTYKVQGLTVSKLLVGLSGQGNSMFRRESPGMMYTMLSKARRLEDIAFTGEFDLSFVQRGPHCLAWMAEEARLKSMDFRRRPIAIYKPSL